MKMTDTLKALGLLFFVASATGCGSDAQAVCDKLDECNMLFGTSVDSCVETGEKDKTDSQLSDCAECVDGKSCETLSAGDCNAACS